MTIYRKMFKIKTIGSSKEGNLKPEIVEKMPAGINLVVHEYNEAAGWAIVELYCSDHPLLDSKYRKTMADLEKLKNDLSIIESVASHPNSPAILATFHIKTELATAIDETAKTLTVKGVTAKFVRKTNDPRRQIIIDEG